MFISFANLILNIIEQNKQCKWYNTGRDSAIECSNYCRPGTHNIEIKIVLKISEQLLATINVSCQTTGIVSSCAGGLK